MKSFKETCLIRRHYAKIRPNVIFPTDMHSQLNLNLSDLNRPCKEHLNLRKYRHVKHFLDTSVQEVCCNSAVP